MRLRYYFLTAWAIALAGVTPAAAATISWNTPGTPTYLNSNGDATATLDQLIAGTEVFGACYPTLCSTVQTIDDTVNGRILTFGAMQFNGDGGYGYGAGTPNTGIPVLDLMTENGAQGGSHHGNFGTTITGLTVGQTYDVQVFFTFLPLNTPGENINGTWFVDAGSTDPSFAIGSFTADASTEALAITSGAFNNFSTILVTDATTVPEPASFAVLGAGLLGLGVIRRQRAPSVV